MSPSLNRRAALGAGLASLMSAPPSAVSRAGVAALALGQAVGTASAASPAVFAGTDGVAARTCPDPIHAALDAARVALCHNRATLARFRGDDSAEAEAACDAAAAARDAADAALRATLPTTLPGLAALAEYHAADMADADGADAFAHLVEALAGVSSLTDLPPAPPPVADPILAEIRAVREAEADLSAALADLDEDDPVRLRRADEAADRSSDARGLLSATRPTSRAGFRALVRFHAEDIARLEPETFGALACREIATALNALPPD